MFTAPNFAQLSQITTLGLGTSDFIIVGCMLLIVLIVDIIAERSGDAMEWLQKKPLPLRWLVYFGIIFILMMLVPVADIGGEFAYAKF